MGGEEREERGTLITALLLLLLLPKWYLEKLYKEHYNITKEIKETSWWSGSDLALGWRGDLLRTLSFTTPPSTRL